MNKVILGSNLPSAKKPVPVVGISMQKNCNCKKATASSPTKTS